MGRETRRWAFQMGAKHGEGQSTRVRWGPLRRDVRDRSELKVRKQECPQLLLRDIIVKANNNGVRAGHQFMPLIKCPGFKVMAETTLVFLDYIAQVLVQGLTQTQHSLNIY